MDYDLARLPQALRIASACVAGHLARWAAGGITDQQARALVASELDTVRAWARTHHVPGVPDAVGEVLDQTAAPYTVATAYRPDPGPRLALLVDLGADPARAGRLWVARRSTGGLRFSDSGQITDTGVDAGPTGGETV